MKSNKKTFSISRQLKSFKYALNGIKILFKEEHNARIHLFASVLAISISLILNIGLYEWLWIISAIILVIFAETLNTAIENLCDFINPEQHEMIKRIKDLSAAAVLLVSILALIIALFIWGSNLVVL